MNINRFRILALSATLAVGACGTAASDAEDVSLNPRERRHGGSGGAGEGGGTGAGPPRLSRRDPAVRDQPALGAHQFDGVGYERRRGSRDGGAHTRGVDRRP